MVGAEVAVFETEESLGNLGEFGVSIALTERPWLLDIDGLVVSVAPDGPGQLLAAATQAMRLGVDRDWFDIAPLKASAKSVNHPRLRSIVLTNVRRPRGPGSAAQMLDPASAVKAAFAAARSAGCLSIGVPLLGTGALRADALESARDLLRGLAEVAERPPFDLAGTRVVLIARNAATADAFRSAWNGIGRRSADYGTSAATRSDTSVEHAGAGDLNRGDHTNEPALDATGPRHHGMLRANYAADSAATAGLLDEDSDNLDIRADVDMLAKLIASKDVRPPLSIGLFGPWGSGKSFLMRQVQLRITDLADRSRSTSDQAATGYLSEVVPIEFNAWQYAHGSALWAALINRVFEGIEERLGGDERYSKVLRDLADKNLGVARAHVRLDRARAKVEQSRPAAADRVIQDVVKDHDIADEATRRLTAGLDLDAATKQVSDLKNEYDRLRTTTSRLGKGWSTAPRVRKMVALALVAIGVAAVVAGILVPAALQQAVALVAGVTSIMAAAVQLLRPVNQGLEQAAKVLEADATDKRELHQAQDDFEQATRELAAAKSSGLTGLYGFVTDRSTAAEYRQHLGMAPIIRDDLERLAEMARKGEGLPGIERIVIFIDDLDRCPASEVVRVLEAVNLLFGFELFVVVVAVDSRWLLRSLERTFSEAFDAEDGSAPTPQNYLEKIIQIPFWLQPMQPSGFERLVTSLAGEVDHPRNRHESGDGNGSGDRSARLWAGASADGQPLPTEGGVANPLTAKANRSAAHGGTEQAGQQSKGRPDDLNPRALRLTQEERDFMLQFLPLVATPRAVKRFLNTYQLLRVSVDDVEAFLASQAYKPVLVLLALVTGTAPITATMIDELRFMTQSDFATFLQATEVEHESPGQRRAESWNRIASACAGLPTAALTPEIIQVWLPRVARYSFHPVNV